MSNTIAIMGTSPNDVARCRPGVNHIDISESDEQRFRPGWLTPTTRSRAHGLDLTIQRFETRIWNTASEH